MARKKTRKVSPKGKAKRGSSNKRRSKPSMVARRLKKIQNMDVDTAMELALIFTCERHDFSDFRGVEAIKLIFLVFSLMYINLNQMEKVYKRKLKKKK